MEYNQECTGEKYREIARAMGVKGVDEMSSEEYRKAAIDAVRKLSEDVGILSKLEAVFRYTSCIPENRLPALLSRQRDSEVKCFIDKPGTGIYNRPCENVHALRN